MPILEAGGDGLIVPDLSGARGGVDAGWLCIRNIDARSSIPGCKRSSPRSLNVRKQEEVATRTRRAEPPSARVHDTERLRSEEVIPLLAKVAVVARETEQLGLD